jgi:hypothetical protein
MEDERYKVDSRAACVSVLAKVRKLKSNPAPKQPRSDTKDTKQVIGQVTWGAVCVRLVCTFVCSFCAVVCSFCAVGVHVCVQFLCGWCAVSVRLVCSFCAGKG